MVLSRAGDEREAVLVREGRGWFQLPSMGHEAVAAIAPHLRPTDHLFTSYRDRALAHARGMKLEEFAKEFFARSDSASGGRNLPGHISSHALNIFSVSSPVASNCLPAVGAAWGVRLNGSSAIVTCHVGDASTREGEFYEALCFAVQEELPVLFVVEDNGYGISTRTEALNPRNLGVISPDLITSVDGCDAEKVFYAAESLIARLRNGEGPFVLWCDVVRIGNHTMADDQRVYRTKTELAEVNRRDPVHLLASSLVRSGQLTWDGYDGLQETTRRHVAEVYEQLGAPGSEQAEILDELYEPTHPAVGERALEGARQALRPSGAPVTMLEAVNRTLGAILSSDHKVVLFGEDIEDPKGGVFGMTKGLSSRFPGRVVNSPLAEATIVGTGVGLAANGWRPILELMFIDFVGPAFSQLIGQVSNLRWRTKGDWTCPLVIYAAYGAFLPGAGMWHSQSNESWFAHIPGIHVAVPSSPADAAGMFLTASALNDPTVILLPKHLLRVKSEAAEIVPVPLGKARVVREGIDCTIVAWGNLVPQAAEAAGSLADHGVSCEVLDLRSIAPCDHEAIARSLAKTGRLVVAQEDNRTCGFGEAILAEVVTCKESFYNLLAPPELVSRADVHIPFNPDQEEAILPTAAKIAAAVRQTLRE